jgi:hypothetical protein
MKKKKKIEKLITKNKNKTEKHPTALMKKEQKKKMKKEKMKKR